MFFTLSFLTDLYFALAFFALYFYLLLFNCQASIPRPLLQSACLLYHRWRHLSIGFLKIFLFFLLLLFLSYMSAVFVALLVNLYPIVANFASLYFKIYPSLFAIKIQDLFFAVLLITSLRQAIRFSLPISSLIYYGMYHITKCRRVF